MNCKYPAIASTDFKPELIKNIIKKQMPSLKIIRGNYFL
jgi:hypothetical protein